MRNKIYVSVRADHLHDGKVIPRMFRLSADDPPIVIDKLLAVTKAGNTEAFSDGLRYICRVEGKEVHLYCSKGLWFILR